MAAERLCRAEEGGAGTVRPDLCHQLLCWLGVVEACQGAPRAALRRLPPPQSPRGFLIQSARGEGGSFRIPQASM